MNSLQKLSHIYLQGVRNSKEQIGRREATRKKAFDSRIADGKSLLPEDFYRYTKACSRKLSRIRTAVLEKYRESMRKRDTGLDDTEGMEISGRGS